MRKALTPKQSSGAGPHSVINLNCAHLTPHNDAKEAYFRLEEFICFLKSRVCINMCDRSVAAMHDVFLHLLLIRENFLASYPKALSSLRAN
jgi:hypothetical protein